VSISTEIRHFNGVILHLRRLTRLKLEEIEALFKHDFAAALANGLATAGAYRGREARTSSLSLASSAMSVAISAFSCLIPSADIRTPFLP